jgi:type II secretory pathway component PulJ
MEVVVAITLLALVLTPLAAMVFKITARSHQIVGAAYRNGVLMEQINQLESKNFDSLAVGTSTVTTTAKPYPYTRTVTVTLISDKFALKAKKDCPDHQTDQHALQGRTPRPSFAHRRNTIDAFNTDDPCC